MAELKMLAIDLGASSGRGIVGRFDGEKLTLEENHRFSNDPVINAGGFNWDILRIYHEIKNSIRNCALSADKDIASIAIDTWGVDYGFLDKNGRLITNPRHYRDERTAGVPEQAFKTMSQSELYGITGIQTMNFNTVFQLLAEQRDNPEIFGMARDMLFVPDLLNYFLTGVKENEYTIASTGALLDARTRDWSREVISRFGLPEHIFGRIAQPGTVVGELLPSVLEEVGDIHAKVIHAASHDTASAVVAVPAKGKDFVYISSGTWSLMGTELAEPCLDGDARKYDFTNEGGAAHTIRFLKNIMGLWLEQESRRQWAREGKKYSFDELSDAAMASTPLRSIINPSDYSFNAPGDMPGRIADYCKKTGQPVPETTGEIVRCIFDSLALTYRWTVDRINAVKGTKAPFINIVGGGCKEAPLCQLTADCCGVPVYAGPTEATAIGNICVQGMALGEIADVAEARHIIRNSFDIKLYEPKTADKAAWDEAYGRYCKLVEG